MTPIEFHSDLRREGYQVMNTSLASNQLNPAHTHDFDARIMVLAGEITITRDGQARTYHAGDYANTCPCSPRRTGRSGRCRDYHWTPCNCLRSGRDRIANQS